mgnify:CR=1 FL=1
MKKITAAFIVVGGTAGAVFLSFPIEDFKTAAHCVNVVYFGKPPVLETLISEIVGYAQKARKEGVIVLEKEAKVRKNRQYTVPAKRFFVFGTFLYGQSRTS